MYRKSHQSDLTPEKFELPVASDLSSENRWVVMADLIPWSELARSRFGGNLRRVARQFEDENEVPFDASLMVYFRERIDQDLVNKVNQKMVENARKKEAESEKKTNQVKEKK